MSHLLAVTRLQSRAMQRPGTVPLWLEFEVSEETAPYLVTSTTATMWLDQPLTDSIIRSAVRAVDIPTFYREVVHQVILKGQECQWGNIHPLTAEGLHAAIDHLEFYELGPMELLIPPQIHAPDMEDPQEGPIALLPSELRPLIEETGLTFRPSSWVPSGTIVVVPKDRGYVGVVQRVAPKQIAGLVHNAARGIAIAHGAVGDLAG